MSASTLLPIIVCADDFAISPEVSEGIALLAEQSRISATSVMSLSPHWPVTSSYLQKVKHQIDVGLHVDFTSEFSIRAGQGCSLSGLMLKSCLRALQPSIIEGALQQQLDLFEAHHGEPPKHIDGHQHVHQFPVIRDVLIKVLCSRYDAAHMPWLRIARIPKSQLNVKGAVINAMGGHALQQLAVQHHMPHSSYLTGIYDFEGDAQTYAQFLSKCLKNLPPNAVLMCHPGLAGPHDVPFPMARVWEQNVFQSNETPELITRLGLKLVRGSQSLLRNF
jgi:hypothetical protein